MSSTLTVPIFALFGEFLIDPRGDVRGPKKSKSYFRRGAAVAREEGLSTSEVQVDAKGYSTLRHVATIRMKAMRIAEESRMTFSSFEKKGEGTPEKIAKVKGCLDRILERESEIVELERSVRQMAILT